MARIIVVFAFFTIQLAACTPQFPGGSETEEVSKGSETEEVSKGSETEEVSKGSETEEVSEGSETEEVSKGSERDVPELAPEELLQVHGAVCNAPPSNQTENIPQNVSDAERCIPVVNLELGLDLDPAKGPYSLDGVDAAHFILDSTTRTIQWNDPKEPKELRLYTVTVKDKDDSLQVTIKMDAALPRAISIIFQSFHKLEDDDNVSVLKWTPEILLASI